MNPSINSIIDQFFRHESGKIHSALVKLLGIGNWETAHDIVQDTLLQAMNTWSYKGLPENPSAWIYRVAKNKAIDFLRREQKFKEISPQYAYLLQSEYTLSGTVNAVFAEEELMDSVLKMMFACCHPSISEESQVALILKTLCGLNTDEIAKAFLSTEETIAKRIYRAKEKIRSDKIELELPSANELTERLDTVLKSIYLLFSEGYNSSHPDHLIRKDLCEEAIRLCTIVSRQRVTAFPRVFALSALMHFQASRLDARLSENREIILLKEQDRSLWNRELIRKGFELLELAAEPFEKSSYHFEAAIASVHASASTFEKTDWRSIYYLYGLLHEYSPNPIVALNKAIAASYAISKQQAIEELLLIRGLDKHYLYYASLGEIYFELDRKEEASKYFKLALAQTQSSAEHELLRKKIALCYYNK